MREFLVATWTMPSQQHVDLLLGQRQAAMAGEAAISRSETQLIVANWI